MATHRLPILAGAIPDASGRSFFEPMDVKLTTAPFSHMVLILLNPGASEVHGVYGSFEVPTNYVDTASFVIVYSTSAADTSIAKLDFDYRVRAPSEDFDVAGFDESLDVDAPDGGTADIRQEVSFTATDGNFTADDTVMYYFTRADESSGDTMAADMIVHNVLFQYNDA